MQLFFNLDRSSLKFKQFILFSLFIGCVLISAIIIKIPNSTSNHQLNLSVLAITKQIRFNIGSKFYCKMLIPISDNDSIGTVGVYYYVVIVSGDLGNSSLSNCMNVTISVSLLSILTTPTNELILVVLAVGLISVIVSRKRSN